MKHILIFCCAGSLFLAGCTSNTTVGDPKEVLTKFFKALSHRDIQEAKKYVTSDSEGMINMMQMSIKNMDAPQESDQFNIEKLDLGEPRIDGDVAKIPVTEKQSQETVNFTLKKEKGDWKVAFDMDTLINMAREKMKDAGVKEHDMDSLLKPLSDEDLNQAKDFLKAHPELDQQKVGDMLQDLQNGSKNPKK